MKIINITVLLLSLSLTSCGQIGAAFRSTDHFIKLVSDDRVLYETDAIDVAQQVAKNLEYSLKKVEEGHHSSFFKPVAIYVCASKESFAKYTGLNQNIKAAVFKEKIFLSASLREQPKRIPTLTTHELSHLHWIQKLGTSKYVRNIPSWYSEGLAVYISGGGGAENVSKSEAAQAILNGSSFYPENTGSMLFPKTASSYGLKPHMFYRQSAMLVEFLKEYNPEKFKDLLHTLETGMKFHQAFTQSFKNDIDSLWIIFKNDGLAKSPISCVVGFWQPFDILHV